MRATAVDSGRAFFRQSGWMVTANTLCGAFMAAVHPVVSAMPKEEYGVFATMLRLFTLLTVPAVGLQTAFAHQAAAAVDQEKERQLIGIVWRTMLCIGICWLGLCAVFALFQRELMETLKIPAASVIWLTAGLALVAIILPVLQGVLQGGQNFLWWGWSMMTNGGGRLGATALLLAVIGGSAATAMAGALIGALVALAVAAWPLRVLLRTPGRSVDWHPWLRQVLPLTLGAGAIVSTMSADMLIVQSHFDRSVTPFYAAAAMIGFALVTFTTPLTAVMFPKVVRSVAQSKPTRALALALAATSMIGVLAAIVCTVFPTLPLRILYFRNLEYLRSAPLVPWFAWAMVPVTVANVLANHLMARRHFRIVPWLVVIAVGYATALVFYSRSSGEVEPFVAFRTIVQILGLTGWLLLAVTLLFTWMHRREFAGRSPY